jgi:hypothetical protein
MKMFVNGVRGWEQSIGHDKWAAYDCVKFWTPERNRHAVISDCTHVAVVYRALAVGTTACDEFSRIPDWRRFRIVTTLLSRSQSANRFVRRTDSTVPVLRQMIANFSPRTSLRIGLLYLH